MRNSFFTMLAVVCGLGAIASAQPSPPHIGYVYPAGGKQGTTFEVTVGGQFLDGAATVHLTGKDIDATVIEHIKPINQGQVNKLREQLDDLRKKPSTPEIQKEMDDIRKKIAIFFNRSSSMAVVETVTMKVTVGKDAAPGERELRLACSTGLSNPLVFEVGQLQEFSRDPSWKTADDRIPNFRFKAPGEPRTGPPPPPTDVALPAIVNGQIMPSAVDRFRFQAKKGQRLVIAVEARKLIPYIADAVPGWFQAAITLYDPSGREVAFADHFRFDPDPVLCYQVPGDGQYSLDIRDSIYRGREDFIYRITMGELPYITSICPLGGHAGKETPVEIRGWNLGAGTRMAATGATADKNLQIATLTFDARGKGPGVYPLSARSDQLTSNSVPFGVDAMPEMQTPKPSGPSAIAQPVAMPVIVNGCIDRPGKWDIFSFQGHAGEEVVAEITARRLNSSLDSLLKLLDASGNQLAFNDGCEDKSSGLITHQADAYIRTKLPADGIYYIHVGDMLHHSGPDYAYRLRISHPMPDFTLRLSPSSINIRSGLSAAVTVYAIRRDGFSGDIDLTLKGAPLGFSIAGGRIPAGKDDAKMTVSAPLTPLKDSLSLSIEGKAKIQGQDVIRPAVPADNMMQAFAYWHLVAAKELDVDVVGRLARSMAQIITPMPLKVLPGRPCTVQISTPTRTPFGELQFQLTDPPDGITIKDVSPLAEGTQITLDFDPDKITASMKGNLYVGVFVLPKMPATAPANPKRIQRRISAGYLPAIAYEAQGSTTMPTTRPATMPTTQTSQATAQK